VVIPGYAWAAHGQRTIARVIYGCYALAAVVFILWLGYLVATCAFGVMVSLHVSGVLHLIGRQSLKLDLRWRMLLSLVAFSAVYLGIYRPLQNQFERRLALPLRVGQKVVIVGAQPDAGTVRQGDWVAYRIPRTLGDHAYLSDGLGFGQVQAVPGARVVFTPENLEVNGALFPRRPYMPLSETWIVPEKHWFIWPDSIISVRGDPRTEAVAKMMREVAMVPESELVGKPFRRWFWRRQELP